MDEIKKKEKYAITSFIGSLSLFLLKKFQSYWFDATKLSDSSCD